MPLPTGWPRKRGQAQLRKRRKRGQAQLNSHPPAGLNRAWPLIPLIRPLFLLYVERETALHLEDTRGLGADVFGRASAEVAGDITALEGDYPRRVFYRPVVTVR